MQHLVRSVVGYYHNRFFFFQLFLFIKVAPQVFRSDIIPKPNLGHKSIGGLGLVKMQLCGNWVDFG